MSYGSASLQQNYAIILAASVLFIVVCFAKSFAKKALLDLDWPKHLYFYSMCKSVERYLRYNGWTVKKSEVPLEYHYLISKGPTEFLLICCPSGMATYVTTVKDFALLRNNEWARKCGLILLMADEPSATALHFAQKEKVLMLHYKSLVAFVQGADVSLDMVEAVFKSSLSKHSRLV